jgi:DNA-binding transcriptional LysR family regulator
VPHVTIGAISELSRLAVSKRISDLEELVKAPLFHRTTKGLEPTASAQAPLRHARVVMRDLQQMEYELAEHATGLCGGVRIHASVSTILQHLPRDLARLRHRRVAKHRVDRHRLAAAHALGPGGAAIEGTVVV